eukprot:2744540-Amphidinium_carterae.1
MSMVKLRTVQAVREGQVSKYPCGYVVGRDCANDCGIWRHLPHYATRSPLSQQCALLLELTLMDG